MNPGHLVLLAAFIILLFNSGARFLLGLTLVPMSFDLGWSRTVISSAATVFMIVSACALPFVGGIVDRFGPRAVLGGGVVGSAIAVAAMVMIHTPMQMLLLYGVVFALGSAATSVTPIGVLVTRWYPDRAGFANSVAIAGMGVGQLLIIAVVAAQIEVIGWRGAYLVVGLATLVVALPFVLLVGRGTPPPMFDAMQPAVSEQTPGADRGVTSVREAFRSWRFCLVLVLYLICGFQDFFMATHVVALALDEGVGPIFAGNMLAFMGLAGLGGVLLAGWLNDRFGPVLPTFINFVARIILFTLLLWSKEPTVIVVAALLYGMTFWMTAPLAVVFARAFCGFALLGVLSGLITMAHHAAGGFGALFGAALFDMSGSYDVALECMLVISIVGAVLTPGVRKRD